MGVKSGFYIDPWNTEEFPRFRLRCEAAVKKMLLDYPSAYSALEMIEVNERVLGKLRVAVHTPIFMYAAQWYPIEMRVNIFSRSGDHALNEALLEFGIDPKAKTGLIKHSASSKDLLDLYSAAVLFSSMVNLDKYCRVISAVSLWEEKRKADRGDEDDSAEFYSLMDTPVMVITDCMVSLPVYAAEWLIASAEERARKRKRVTVFADTADVFDHYRNSAPGTTNFSSKLLCFLDRAIVVKTEA